MPALHLQRAPSATALPMDGAVMHARAGQGALHVKAAFAALMHAAYHHTNSAACVCARSVR